MAPQQGYNSRHGETGTSYCYQTANCAPPATDRRSARTLLAFLGINTVMVAVGLSAGLVIDSVALLTNSLDLLGAPP